MPVSDDAAEQPGQRFALAEAPPETWRLFVAAELPATVQGIIARAPVAMFPHVSALVRWIKEDSLHITLKFLGDVEPDQVEELQSGLSAAAAQSGNLTVKLSETGSFPHPRNPKILWVGLTGETKRLVQLQARVEGAMAKLEFEPERRKFVPHITAGRAMRDLTPKQAGDVGFGWKRVRIPANAPEIPITSITLFRSHLEHGGARYKRIFQAPLG